MQPTKDEINVGNFSDGELANKISKKVNELLETKKCSVSLLSSVTGISQTTINNLRRGEGNPTIGTLSLIANYFNISLAELLSLEHNAKDWINTAVLNIYDLRSAHLIDDVHIVGKRLIEVPQHAVSESLIGVMVSNNSLLPLYEKGTIFVVSMEQEHTDGDILLIRMKNNMNALSRCYFNNEQTNVKNINIDGNIEKYNNNEIAILGVVIQIIQTTI